MTDRMNFENINEREQIKELKRKMLNLQAQLEIQQNTLTSTKGVNLLRSENIDLYPGEQHDFVLSILRQIRDRCPEGARSRDIVDSLLKSNSPVGKGEEILTGVEKVFHHGHPTNQSEIAALEKLGFKYTPSRKHPKLRFHDKYMFVLSSTPGDNQRGAKNCLAEIGKCIAVRQKV